MFDEAKSELEEERELTQKAMENLGQAKYKIYNESIIPFVDVFSKIKNVSFEDNSLDDATNLPAMSAGELARMKTSVLEIKGVLSGGITALGSGGLAGLAAYGGVGVLGTASTGTAIGTLSGAAATNATLAWLGGGSLAAGGYGMAGGMMVLGGVVAGPVLAVGGMMMASKAEAAKEDAYGNLDKAELASEQMKEARVAASGIRLRFEEITKVLRSLELRFQPLLQSLNELVESNTNYSTYSEEDRKGVMIAASTAKVLKNLLEAPIIDNE
ncbi:hypothetical protein ACEV77_24345, partial [Vibrio parahaemolyticus]